MPANRAVLHWERQVIYMGAIQAGIEMNGDLANVLNTIVSTVNVAYVKIENIQGALSGLTAPEVTIPIHWRSDDQEVFTGTGVDRFRQEVQSTNAMLQQLCSTQDAIAKRAYNNNIFSTDIFQDLNSLAVRMDGIRERIQQIENNPVNFGTDTANSELEQLRGQVYTALQEQNVLNAAVRNMDVSAANEAYLKLSQTVSGSEQYIRDNVDEQGRFNKEIQEGAAHTKDLADKVKGVISSYVNMENFGKALDLSDELVQTTARLDLVNDGAQTTQELMHMVYAAAQDAGGSFSQMADMVVDIGNQAGNAFGSSEEMVAFADLVQKQVAMSGASPGDGAGVMSQLSQGMSAGALGSGEVSAILEQAPAIARTIESSMGWAEGSILSYAEQGLVTADVVKNAMFRSADEINARFGEMPGTWEQAGNRMQNTALMAFQPVLLRLNELANSEAFQMIVNVAGAAMSSLAGILMNIFDLLALVGDYITDNWSAIGPIILGIVGALAIYYGWQLAIKAIELVGAVAKTLLALATGGLTAATTAQAGAQTGLNAAMAACPIVWIIVLVLALIAIIYVLCTWIAKVTGVANSGLGIIVGALAVAAAFIGNLFVALINLIIDIVARIWNYFAAFANFFGNFLNDPVGSIVRLFADMADNILSMLQAIAGTIDTIFGSNLAGSVQGWRDSLDGLVKEQFGEGEEFVAEINGADWHLKRFEYGKAWDAGVGLGDGIADSISNFDISDILNGENLPGEREFGSGYEEDSGLLDNVGNIAGDTGAMKDSMDIAQEDLKYLRDIAEQEAVNRYTLAEVKVEQTNHNNISGNMDLDGVVSGLTDAVNEAVASITEGVHA